MPLPEVVFVCAGKDYSMQLHIYYSIIMQLTYLPVNEHYGIGLSMASIKFLELQNNFPRSINNQTTYRN